MIIAWIIKGLANLRLAKELIQRIEQKYFFKKHDTLSEYKIQETLSLEKPKHLKLQTFFAIFFNG